jgi:cobalt/nickel transport system permease protein
MERARRQVGSLDDLARLDSPVHRLDPRVKVLVTLVYVVCVVSFGKYDLGRLAPLAMYPAVVIGLARLPLRPLVRWILPALPLVLLIGVANPFLDREVVGYVGGFAIAGGWVSFGSIAARLLLTVLAGLLLAATTGMQGVCGGLAGLGVPRVVTTQLLLMFRYLFVLTEEAGRVLRAHRLRAAGNGIALRMAGPLSGRLLLRAMDRAQRIHQAMLCRGFDGRLHRLSEGRQARRTDLNAVWLIGWTAFLALTRLYDLPLMLGEIVHGVAGR